MKYFVWDCHWNSNVIEGKMKTHTKYKNVPYKNYKTNFMSLPWIFMSKIGVVSKFFLESTLYESLNLLFSMSSFYPKNVLTTLEQSYIYTSLADA